MSGTEKTPPKSRAQLKVEHSLANAVAAEASPGAALEVDNSYVNKQHSALFIADDSRNLIVADVTKAPDGGLTVGIVVNTHSEYMASHGLDKVEPPEPPIVQGRKLVGADPKFDNAMEAEAIYTVKIDKDGHVGKVGQVHPESPLNSEGQHNLQKARKIAAAVVKSEQSSQSVPLLKATFKGYKP